MITSNINGINFALFASIFFASITTLLSPEFMIAQRRYSYGYYKYFIDYFLIIFYAIYVFIFMLIFYNTMKIIFTDTKENPKITEEENIEPIIKESANITKKEVFSLSERMKKYENNCKLISSIDGNDSFIIRLDGRNFSRLTSQFKKPFDNNFSKIMLDTAVDLFKEFNPTFIHVQSDEISLVFKNKTTKEAFRIEPLRFSHIFGGRVNKIITIMASYASSRFHYNLYSFLKETKEYPKLKSLFKDGNINISFDGRLTLVNNDISEDYEIINYVYWRSVIAGYNNAVSMFASKVFDTHELEKVSTHDRIQKMMEKSGSFDFNNQKNHIKYGWFIKNSYYVICNHENKPTLRKNPTALSFKIKYSTDLKENFLGETWDDSKIKDTTNIEIMGF